MNATEKVVTHTVLIQYPGRQRENAQATIQCDCRLTKTMIVVPPQRPEVIDNNRGLSFGSFTRETRFHRKTGLKVGYNETWRVISTPTPIDAAAEGVSK